MPHYEVEVREPPSSQSPGRFQASGRPVLGLLVEAEDFGLRISKRMGHSFQPADGLPRHDGLCGTLSPEAAGRTCIAPATVEEMRSCRHCSKPLASSRAWFYGSVCRKRAYRVVMPGCPRTPTRPVLSASPSAVSASAAPSTRST